MLAQHGAHGDVDAAAGGVSGRHLGFEIFDFFDRTISEDLVIIRDIALDAVLEIVADDANVVQPGVFDRDRQG